MLLDREINGQGKSVKSTAVETSNISEELFSKEFPFVKRFPKMKALHLG